MGRAGRTHPLAPPALGVLAGSAAAAIALQQRLDRQCVAAPGPRPRVLVDCDPALGDPERDDPRRWEEILTEQGRRIAGAGAELLLFTSAAAHTAQPRVERAVARPVLSRIEAAAEAACRLAGDGAVGILAGPACLDAGLYQWALRRRRRRVLMSESPPTEEASRVLAALRRRGAAVVIVDLPHLEGAAPADPLGTPVVDAAEAQAAAAIAWARGEAPLPGRPHIEPGLLGPASHPG
ncbi:hypothetical protein [Phenylobacterium sp.]|uniref:hypothetical protein n=1 Tax=Phenylobacterium sp. TaxID=1871053 RepID=UPI00391D0095